MPRKIPVLPLFTPLDKKHLAESVMREMLVQPVAPLPPSPFVAAGVYAIYYMGDFPLYEKIAKMNRGGAFAQPIYVGKAVPEGARKGGFGLGENLKQVLYTRLRDHAKSVDLVSAIISLSRFCRAIRCLQSCDCRSGEPQARHLPLSDNQGADAPLQGTYGTMPAY